VLLGVVEEQRTLTRELSATSAGQLVETLRRARHLPMEDYPGDPEPMPMVVEAGRQVAKVAITRRILTLCFYGLRDGEIRCLAPRAGARTLRETAVSS
jgi:hypothetical protein